MTVQGALLATINVFEGRLLKRTLMGNTDADEHLLRQALEAIQAYNEAEAQRQPTAEVDRLHLKADHLYQVVIGHQLYKAGCLGEPVY